MEAQKFKTILSIESSCDETAAAIVQDGVTIIAESLATSRELHEKTGGVVPEIAARKQVEFIVPVINDCLEKAAKHYGVSTPREVQQKIDAIAVTVGPGLVGSLIVGVEAAKALALAWDIPIIPVNHLVGHIYGNFLQTGNTPEPHTLMPAVVLVVSGGHTDLIYMKDHGQFEYLGGTFDDAAGECFDKTARMLGLAQYLGGVLVSKEAAKVTENTIKGFLPRPLITDDTFDFSFSGLKTAVKRLVEKQPDLPVTVIAREFEEAVVDVLVAKTLRAAQKYNVRNILLAGGVSANTRLRTEMVARSGSDFKVYFPRVDLCTDNAIYIASAAYFTGKTANIEDVRPDPSLTVMD